MNIIECKNVSKSFGKQQVFENFSLELEEGKIYGLLGRNGAGKTTLLNLLTTRYIPGQGEILVHGEPVYENEKQLRNICFMADWVSGFAGLRIREIFRRAKVAYPTWNQEYAERLLEVFELNERQIYGNISKGQMTAVGVIVGMASGCEIVLFDEIYSGLDAVAREQFYKILLDDYEKSQRTFVVSSHLIEEMDRLFTDVIIMKKGKILVNEEFDNLMEHVICVKGRTEVIEALDERNVLSKENTGVWSRAVLYGQCSQQELEKMQQQGLEIGKASLQELFVAMVS